MNLKKPVGPRTGANFHFNAGAPPRKPAANGFPGMNREPFGPRAPAGRERVPRSVREFLRASQNRRCNAALRHLLRAWPVYSSLSLEYEELLDSLRMARTRLRLKPGRRKQDPGDLKTLCSMIAWTEERLDLARLICPPGVRPGNGNLQKAKGYLAAD